MGSGQAEEPGCVVGRRCPEGPCFPRPCWHQCGELGAVSGFSQPLRSIAGLAGTSKSHKLLVCLEQGWRFTCLQGSGTGLDAV